MADSGAPQEVLELVSQGLQDCGPDDVHLQMLAAPVNPSDINAVEGVYPIQPREGIPGNEGTGEVLRVGANVKHLQPGDRAVPLTPGLGTWRTAGIFAAEDWHPVSAQLRVADAATLTINPLTALGMLEECVELQPGDCVVQNGANSAVGQHVIAIAKAKGLHTINIVRGGRPDWQETESRLKQLGADLVVAPDKARAAAKASGLPEPKLGLNCTGGELATLALKMLGHGGTLVTYGAMAKQPVAVPAPLLIYKDCRLRGFWCSGNSRSAHDVGVKRQALDRAAQMAESGAIRAQCTDVPFSKWRRAFERHCAKPLLIMQPQ